MIVKRLQKLGGEKAAKDLRLAYPKTTRAWSGDLGEILATEYVNRHLNSSVLIYRSRWKDRREVALRGDDIIAVRLGGNNAVHFLKGEAKSRKVMPAGVIQEAMAALFALSGNVNEAAVNNAANSHPELLEAGFGVEI